MSDRELLIREAPLTVADDGDGRTLEARIVPYGETATICDPPDFVVEQEMFVPGCVEKQIRAAHRVKMWVSTMHEQGLRGIVGHSESLEERDDGLYSTLTLHDNEDGMKARQLVRDGLLRSLSVEFIALKSLRRNGVVERVRAHIDRVSLVPVGAYASAEVLALRAEAIAAFEAGEPDIDVDCNVFPAEGTASAIVVPSYPRLREIPQTLAYQLAARGFNLEADTDDTAAA